MLYLLKPYTVCLVPPILCFRLSVRTFAHNWHFTPSLKIFRRRTNESCNLIFLGKKRFVHTYYFSHFLILPLGFVLFPNGSYISPTKLLFRKNDTLVSHCADIPFKICVLRNSFGHLC